jgi:hypothetical protein
MNKYIKALVLISFLFHTCCVCAEVGVSKDWIWSTDDKSFYFALTVNSNKHNFGQYCALANAQCFYMVGIDITCEPDSAYPALVNSNKGAYNVTLRCAHENNGQTIFAVRDFDTIDGLVREASNIGFVLPMNNGQFKVVRFSLMGSSDAISQMRAAAKKVVEDAGAQTKPGLPREELM